MWAKVEPNIEIEYGKYENFGDWLITIILELLCEISSGGWADSYGQLQLYENILNYKLEYTVRQFLMN